MMTPCSTFQRTAVLFTVVVVPFVLSWKNCVWVPISSHHRQTSYCVYLFFDYSHPFLCVNLLVIITLIPNNTEHFFWLLIDHLYICLGKMCIPTWLLCVNKLFQYNSIEKIVLSKVNCLWIEHLLKINQL